jgi:hypothetical protein
MVTEPEGSTPLIPKLAIEHDPEPVSFISTSHNLYRRDPLQNSPVYVGYSHFPGRVLMERQRACLCHRRGQLLNTYTLQYLCGYREVKDSVKPLCPLSSNKGPMEAVAKRMQVSGQLYATTVFTSMYILDGKLRRGYEEKIFNIISVLF